MIASVVYLDLVTQYTCPAVAKCQWHLVNIQVVRHTTFATFSKCLRHLLHSVGDI